MKILLYSFLLAYVLASCSEEITAPPQLEVKNRWLNLGTIRFDSTYLLKYEVKNTGGKELRIDTITSSCGCSLPGISKKIIAPSDTAVIMVSYKPVDRGKFNKSLVVKSNADSVFAVLRFSGETGID